MSSNLVTKGDLILVRHELAHVGQSMTTRFEALDAQFEALDMRFQAMESRLVMTLQNMEFRIVFKLGALMAVLLGLSIVLLK